MNRNISKTLALIENCERTSIIGECTVDDIKTLEVKYSISLPDSYKDYLLSMGKGIDGIVIECYIFPNVINLTTDAREFMEYCKTELKLPPKAFVFHEHHGYDYYFFICDGKDDPVVYRYLEDDNYFSEWSSFSDYILNEVEKSIKFAEKFEKNWDIDDKNHIMRMKNQDGSVNKINLMGHVKYLVKKYGWPKN